MPMLDRSRPYGEVWGATGCAGFVQDGREYDLAGRPRGGEVIDAPTVRSIPAKRALVAPEPSRSFSEPEKLRWGLLRAKGYLKLNSMERQEYRALKAIGARDAPQPDVAPPVVLEQDQPPDDELRTMVEIAGGAWTDRAAALAFLEE